MITCYYKLKFHTSSKMLFLSKKNRSEIAVLLKLLGPSVPRGSRGDIGVLGVPESLDPTGLGSPGGPSLGSNGFCGSQRPYRSRVSRGFWVLGLVLLFYHTFNKYYEKCKQPFLRYWPFRKHLIIAFFSPEEFNFF